MKHFDTLFLAFQMLHQHVVYVVVFVQINVLNNTKVNIHAARN